MFFLPNSIKFIMDRPVEKMHVKELKEILLRKKVSLKGLTYDVLASSCTCVAGSLGFCNHAVGLMYLVSHYSMTKAKMIPDDLVCTSLPQQWHRPRGKNISSEPLMEIIFKKPKLGTTCTGESTSVSASPGITCSLYPAISYLRRTHHPLRRSSKECNAGFILFQVKS